MNMNIAQIAALVAVTPKSVYSPSAAFDDMVDEYSTRHAVDAQQLRAARKLLPPGLFKPLQETMKQILQLLHDNSSPWSETGHRIVRADKVADLEFALTPLVNRFHTEREYVLTKWPAVEADMRARLNGAFDEDKFPTPDKIRKHTTITVTWSPLATAGDWRIDVPQSIVDSTTQSVTAALRDQQQHIKDRVIDTVRALMDKCRGWEPGKSKLHDSTFTRVNELITVIPGLMLVEDAQITNICADASKLLSGLTPDDIKESEVVRRRVADEAAEILRNLGL